MGERVNGIHEVRGSIPLASTSPTLRANIRQGVGTQHVRFHGRATRDGLVVDRKRPRE